MKLLSSFILAILALVVLPSLVSAACCINQEQGTCSTVPDTSNACSGTFTLNSCSSVPECAIGCCCQSQQATRQVACSNPTNFIPNSSLSSGQTCTCDVPVTLSGYVRDQNGFPLGGAVVSSGSISTVSDSSSDFGAFSLSGIPPGSVVLSASKDGCSIIKSFDNVFASRSDISLEIVCSCSPGCNINQNTYCDAEQRLHAFNLSINSEKASYCSFCRPQDATDCGVLSECVNNDGICPLSCSDQTDTDCLCSGQTRNGMCPHLCDSTTDEDCGQSLNVVCSDGLVHYPFETCDVNQATGNYTSGQANRCLISSCNTGSCQCTSTTTCGNGVLDAGEQCEGTNICSGGQPCNGCICGQNCTDAIKAPTISASFSKSSGNIAVNWVPTSPCNLMVDKYELFKCELNSINPSCSDKETFSFVDEFDRSRFNYSFRAEPNSDYSFYVKAYYTTSGLDPGVSGIARVTTGSAFCMNRDPNLPDEFCRDNKRSRCDINNNIVVLENCALSDPARPKFCVGPDAFSQTRCEEANPCLQCNGLFGMFASYLDLKVSLGGEDFFCAYNPNQPTRPLVPGCYLDKNRFMFEAFNSCGNVDSCYDFKSEEACTGQNRCSANFDNSRCEWATLPLASDSGVCRPKEIREQDCSLCDNPSVNFLAPKCTPQACSLFGSVCNYQGAGSSPSCTSRAVNGCMNYTTQASCEGGVPVSVNAVYNSSGTRISGTHQLTRSNDEFGLGKCYWDVSTSRCRKDADGLRANLVTGTGFDCISNPQCESDFVSPVTIIADSVAGDYPANPVFKYSLSDNVYPPSAISTFFCVAPFGQVCYPDEPGTTSGGVRRYAPSGFNVSGDYSVFFYSQDFSKNLEVVRSLRVKIDADVPYVELYSPRNDSDLATNLAELRFYGRVAPDAEFVCAKNAAINFERCIVRCDAPGRNLSDSCISISGNDAFFNFTLRIGMNDSSFSSTRNIIFTAEDLVGNRYQNTLLGIIYDVVPPPPASISIR